MCASHMLQQTKEVNFNSKKTKTSTWITCIERLLYCFIRLHPSSRQVPRAIARRLSLLHHENFLVVIKQQATHDVADGAFCNWYIVLCEAAKRGCIINETWLNLHLVLTFTWALHDR